MGSKTARKFSEFGEGVSIRSGKAKFAKNKSVRDI
jgi:hypothetical protein